MSLFIGADAKLIGSPCCRGERRYRENQYNVYECANKTIINQTAVNERNDTIRSAPGSPGSWLNGVFCVKNFIHIDTPTMKTSRQRKEGRKEGRREENKITNDR